jgi:hypothetical protein
MAITQTWATSFKRQVLLGEHDLDTDVLKIALYTDTAILGPDTSVYTTVSETSGAGYVAGGIVLVNVTVNQGNGIAYVSFDNPSWAGASFTARGALIYNSSKANKAMFVLDFGLNQTAVSENFVLALPADNPTFSLIKLT